MSENVAHGYMVAGETLDLVEPDESALNTNPLVLLGAPRGDVGIEFHYTTMGGAPVVILAVDYGYGEPLNLLLQLAADKWLEPIGGAAYVFGYDYADHRVTCIPDEAADALEAAAASRRNEGALRRVRARTRIVLDQAADLLDTLPSVRVPR